MEVEMEYTKGEWKYEEDGVVVATDGKQIASVFPRDRKGNSHLIAAAPDMYETLKAIVVEGTRCLEITQQDKSVRDLYNIDGIDRIARLALAKAEGK